MYKAAKVIAIWRKLIVIVIISNIYMKYLRDSAN